MQTNGSRRALLNYVGIGILIAGMALGEFIYWRSLRAGSSGGQDAIAWQYDSRAYQQDVKEYMGTFGLIMDGWSRAMGRLAEPGPLAIAIGLGSIAAAGACFWAASRMPRE